MGLWSNLFRHAGRGDSALLTPGKSFPSEGPSFPDLGPTLLVSDGAPIELSDIIGNTKSGNTNNKNNPTIVLIYSNC